MSDLPNGAYINKGARLIHTALVTRARTRVTVVGTNLKPDKGRTWIALQDECGREWKAYGSCWNGDDYSDFQVVHKGTGRGGFAKGMRI